MSIVNVMWANPKTLYFEPLLLNSDYIVSIRHFKTTAKGSFCVVLITGGDELLIRGTLEDLEEEIYYTSQHDSKPAHMEQNPWGQK